MISGGRNMEIKCRTGKKIKGEDRRWAHGLQRGLKAVQEIWRRL
jgi:hypothetical protein